MGQVWSKRRAPDKVCPQCGANHEVTIQRVPHKEPHVFCCGRCGHEERYGHSTDDYSYKLESGGAAPAE